MKSTVQEIRERFDKDVERFSNLNTGQTATMDAPLIMDMVTRVAGAVTPHARDLLDIGCGAGNYSLKMLESQPGLNVTLVDLSRPMLDRAVQRVSAATPGKVAAQQGDIRELELGREAFDLVLAAQVLHHLRGDEEWIAVFGKIFHSLRPGGSFWIADHIEHDIAPIQAIMHKRWGEHLASGSGGDAYRDKVFAYTEKEDTPRPVMFQLDVLRRVGFSPVDVLHKNAAFAAFGGIKPVV
jgi:tRNA (cmo5U34)-methyltransferase